MAEKSSNSCAGNSEEDCSVCLQPCVYPVVLPCKHVFCFLCVKGLARTTRNCAMCRQQFPLELLENPPLKCPVEESSDSGFEDGHQWFYEGRNGWWQYDERTSREIENAHKIGSKVLEVSIAGRVYIVDFENMEQRQKVNSMKARRIKRDLISISKKGISGIRMTSRSISGEDLETRLALLNLFNLQDE